MNFIKALVSWKLWLALLLGIGLLVGLWFFTFDFLAKYTNHGVEVTVPDLSEMTIQEAMAELNELQLKYEIDSVKFTEDFAPYAILDYFPKEGSTVKPGRRIFIKSNPSSWAPIELPDLMHKSKRLAETLLHMKGFVLGDTIYVRDPARNAVLGALHDNDTVRAGELFKRGAKIDLILGRGFNMDMPVPTVTELSLKEAKNLLKEHYFDMGQIYYLGDTQDTLNMRVVYQDPPGLEPYDEGLPVSIWLSASELSEIRKDIDSLNRQYRRKMDEKDSLFIKSIESAKNIDLRDLSEEVRNAVKFDQNTNKEMRTTQPKPSAQPKNTTIDTTGITIH